MGRRVGRVGRIKNVRGNQQHANDARSIEKGRQGRRVQEGPFPVREQSKLHNNDEAEERGGKMERGGTMERGGRKKRRNWEAGDMPE